MTHPRKEPESHRSSDGGALVIVFVVVCILATVFLAVLLSQVRRIEALESNRVHPEDFVALKAVVNEHGHQPTQVLPAPVLQSAIEAGVSRLENELQACYVVCEQNTRRLDQLSERLNALEEIARVPTQAIASAAEEAILAQLTRIADKMPVIATEKPVPPATPKKRVPKCSNKKCSARYSH